MSEPSRATVAPVRAGLARDALGVGLLATATLLLETTLTRLLAISQSYHFAFLAISLALLGFGASGSVLTLWPGLARQVTSRLLPLAGAGFALSVAFSWLAVNWLPFDSYRIAWERRQLLYLTGYCLALALPFVWSGLGIGGALAGRSERHLVYAGNLAGSALGTLLALLAMAAAGVPGALLASALLALGLILLRPARRVRLVVAGSIGGGLVALGLLAWLNWQAAAPLGLELSPYRGLAHLRRYPGAETVYARWGATARVDVLSGAGVRQLPGLSYAYGGLPPAQLGLSLDGESPQPVTLLHPEEFEAAAYLPEAVAFQLRPAARVLVLEPAGGLGVLQALAGGAREVIVTLSSGLVRDAVARAAPAYDVYADPRVTVVIEPPRSTLARGGVPYDVVFLPLTDSYRPVTAGSYSLGETYLLTREALGSMLDRLAPGGLLVATRWLQTPPSEDLRLLATVVAALEARGQAPAERIVAYRSLQTLTVLVRPAGWSDAELARLRAFLDARRYDLVWAPGVQPDEVNRYNRMPSPEHYQAAKELLAGMPERFLESYPFAVEPVTDERPFFFHFFRWRQTPEVLAAVGYTWQPFGGSGYLVLLVLLAVVVVLSLALILAPLLVRRPALAGSTGLRAPAFVYFGAIGLGFLLVEIPLIQMAILSLGQPSLAFAVVAALILSGAGVGSSVANRVQPSGAVSGVVAVLAAGAAITLPALLTGTLGWPLAGRVLVLAVGVLPLAIVMGLPFPIGLGWLSRRSPGLVPWVWAVNGCASVVGGVTAAILALSLGLRTTVLVGAACYALALLAALWAVRSPAPRLVTVPGPEA